MMLAIYNKRENMSHLDGPAPSTMQKAAGHLIVHYRPCIILIIWRRSRICYFTARRQNQHLYTFHQCRARINNRLLSACSNDRIALTICKIRQWTAPSNRKFSTTMIGICRANSITEYATDLLPSCSSSNIRRILLARALPVLWLEHIVASAAYAKMAARFVAYLPA